MGGQKHFGFTLGQGQASPQSFLPARKRREHVRVSAGSKACMLGEALDRQQARARTLHDGDISTCERLNYVGMDTPRGRVEEHNGLVKLTGYIRNGLGNAPVVGSTAR